MEGSKGAKEKEQWGSKGMKEKEQWDVEKFA